MADYTQDAADALAAVADAGAAVTFTFTTPGTYDESTDTWSTPTTDTVTGSAIEIPGNPMTYQALSLVRSKAPSLFFAPDTYGDLPDAGYVVTWGGVAYTVKDVQPLQPDGMAIAATIVVAV